MKYWKKGLIIGVFIGILASIHALLYFIACIGGCYGTNPITVSMYFNLNFYFFWLFNELTIDAIAYPVFVLSGPIIYGALGSGIGWLYEKLKR